VIDAALDWLATLFALAQAFVFEQAVQPLLFAAGQMRLAEQAFDATEWALIGAIEVALLALLMPLAERRWPAERFTDRRAVRVDVIYTLLHRLGGFALLAFALLTPLVDALEAQLRLAGFSRLEIDRIWPGLTDIPIVSFLLYLAVLDLVDYWVHRGQHRFQWWWALHAVHHSQQRMTFWSDNRNHLLDDLIRDAIVAAVAILIGVAPGQFLLLVVASRVMQSVHHANLRWRWGGIAERLVVSPSFHRLHHAIGYGHEGAARGCNFAVLFPVWDILFRTADWRPGFVATGIRDQLEGRDYGKGFWAQQWLALVRVARGMRARGVRQR
jgi:sterol desaturase/sphingolipid hydroxylase (fatty acid hydroxylase superfamily)